MKINYCRLVILLALFVVGIQSFSALILSIAPAKLVAIQTHWTFLGLEKKTWGDLHGAFGVAFLVMIVLHLFHNRKSLFRHLHPRQDGKANLELLLALIAVALYFLIVIIVPDTIGWL